MPFVFKAFQELTVDELYDILQLRSEIFVVEQTCIYNDLDGFDKEAVHLLSKKEGRIIAYARLLKPGTRFANFSIGRVVVKESERGTGLGIELMNAAKNYIINELGATKIKISAQSYLQRFYENLGFHIVTEIYLEDGIPHYGMVFEVNNHVR
ncbi:MAG TPA: GNAT family N-acetyltransferase [Prolixibacteraceae bacterium]|nr:GNAT family N-acetyltransferase [Prolixibacteraceae bacterium]